MESSYNVQKKIKKRGNEAAVVSSPSTNPPGNNYRPPAPDNYNAMDETIQGDKEAKSGMRYSLRSQLKRPIHSEPDQSKEPLTKKPTNGSKQHSTVKLTQEFQRRMKPHDERFPSEIALNVDLVVKSLFRYMNCSTLKSCRLVCKRWKYFGAKELQRRRNVATHLSFGYVIDKSEKSVRSLLTVMQNADANTFPCSSFDILTAELSSPRIKNVLSVAEARNPIKQLSLKLNYQKKKLPLAESTLLEDLRDLLYCQVPNLEDLEILFCLPSHWADGLNTWDSGFFHLENSSHLLPKLTSLNLSEARIPRKLFEYLMDAAVNLQSYAGSDFSPELLEYFVDGNGRHRIQLLKHLRFNLDGAFVEVMERLMSQHGFSLKLESFYFINFWTIRNNIAQLWSRASCIISQLLEASSSTIARLGITLLRFLPGLAIPRLPNLHYIYLAGNVSDHDIANNFFFPCGFSIANSFPNLLSISFLWGSTLMSLEMLSITEPIMSVKHIWIGDSDAIDDYVRGRLHAKFPLVELIEEGL